MKWLGIDWDEGPFFQMKRLDALPGSRGAAHRRRPRVSRLHAQAEELDALRAQQSARGEKPRYDRAIGQKYRGTGPAPVRFKTPQEGEVGWNDLVKGPIAFPNAELDDLVLLRADGVPTYNFGVVVDDLDMGITHVIRGDDHVNNTPRQIHIFNALKKPLPAFAHVPMILGADGERLSKRHGAVSVTQYRDEGYPARGAGQLPRAPGLVARRRGDLLDGAAGAVVRPRARVAARRRSSIPRSWRGSTSST